MKRHSDLFREAQEVIPGGVNSPVRAFGAVDMQPIFASHAKGATLFDAEGHAYIDYIQSWGPLILGHGSEIACRGINEVILNGTTFGLPTQIEIELAKEVIEAYQGIDMIRFVNSGTEATMSAIRLARGYTGKSKFIKFQGCYHGHSDSLLVKSGSGALTHGIPTSEGVPQAVIQDTLIADFNNLESVHALIKAHGDEIAAVIVEPIPGNMGLVAPDVEFLIALRTICTENKIVLIFDEVISGFRIAYNGAAGYYGIEPDLVCLGKIIGGGLPVGAYGGKREIMMKVAPVGAVYQAGTLSGNPVAMRMGLNVIRHLKQHPEIYKDLEEKAQYLEAGFRKNLKELQVTFVTINRVGSLICQFFTNGPVNTYSDVMASDTHAYAIYFQEMLNRGILLPPAQFECMFLSTAHDHAKLDQTVQAHYESLKQLLLIQGGRYV